MAQLSEMHGTIFLVPVLIKYQRRSYILELQRAVLVLSFFKSLFSPRASRSSSLKVVVVVVVLLLLLLLLLLLVTFCKNLQKCLVNYRECK